MRWLIAIAELAIVVWFVAIGMEAAFQRAFVDRESPFRLGELHHAWIGAGLVVAGFWIPGVTGILAQLLGVVLSLDDLHQHKVQTLDGRHRYLSPLHQLFGKYIWPLPGIPALTRLLDRWWFVGVVFGLLLLWWLT
jgi:hypothetical protein